MKINNVEKFRKEIYDAVKDALSWKWRTIETPTCIMKNGYEYKELMNEINTYEPDDETKYKCVSLAHPLIIEDGDKKLYVTIDDEGASFFKNSEDRYVNSGYCFVDYYRNRMSFAMALVNDIAERMEK